MPNAYDAITSKLIAQLEAGVVPWKQPWANRAQGAHLPTNLASGKTYRGINFAMLSWSHYSSPYWLTYKQAAEMGGQVRKGEKSTPVVFWQFNTGKDVDATTGKAEKSAPWCKQYAVFNVEQVDGLTLPLPFDAPSFDPIQAAQEIADRYLAAAGPRLLHGGSQACYMPSRDSVYMPHGSDFHTRESYYATLFHELAHSTGAAHRLDRELGKPFGSKGYADEELTAEFTAAFLAAEAGIGSDNLDGQSAAYIKNWLTVLRSDNRIAVTAAQRAQKAADLIMGRSAAAAATSELEVAA